MPSSSFWYGDYKARARECCSKSIKCTPLKFPAKYIIVKSTAVATIIQNCTRSKRLRLKMQKSLTPRSKNKQSGLRRHSRNFKFSKKKRDCRRRLRARHPLWLSTPTKLCPERFLLLASPRGASEGVPSGPPGAPRVARWPAPLPQAGRRVRSGRTWPARRRSPSSTTASHSPPPCRPAFGWWTAETLARRRAWPLSSTRRPSTSPSWRSKYKTHLNCLKMELYEWQIVLNKNLIALVDFLHFSH